MIINNELIRKIIIVILVIIDILIFRTIFVFSGQNGDESTKISRGITESVTSNIKSIQNESDEIEKENKLFIIEVIIRKMAHFSLYTVMGLITMSIFILLTKIEDKHKILYTLLIGIIYSITDELHQLFVADRAAKLMDVAIDSIGVIFGMYIIFVMYRLNISKKYNIKCKNKN